MTHRRAGRAVINPYHAEPRQCRDDKEGDEEKGRGEDEGVRTRKKFHGKTPINKGENRERGRKCPKEELQQTSCGSTTPETKKDNEIGAIQGRGASPGRQTTPRCIAWLRKNRTRKVVGTHLRTQRRDREHETKKGRIPDVLLDPIINGKVTIKTLAEEQAQNLVETNGLFMKQNSPTCTD